MKGLWSKETLLWPWLAGIALLAVVGIVIAVVAPSGSDTTPAKTLDSLSSAQLTDLKLRAEIRKLEHDEQPNANVLPIVGAVVTVGGLLATVLGLFLQRAKEARDRVDEQNEAREERQADAKRRAEELEKERVERAAAAANAQEERFTALGTSLASDSAGERVSGLVGIFFFTDVSAEYRERLFVLLRGVLTVDRFKTSDRALARAFVALLKRRCKDDRLATKGLDLQDVELRDVDLAYTILDGISGEGLKLQGARLHGATFDGARLTAAVLTGCRGRASFADAVLTEARLEQATLGRSAFMGANLKRARLDAAKLVRCDCRDAAFDGAAATSVHFVGADLKGATFRRADVKEALFHGADLNEKCLRSLLKARNLQRKSFDDDIVEELLRLNAGADPFAGDPPPPPPQAGSPADR
jgi:uncharacterized protein YjbI with pentapeptide repeats